MTGIAFDNFTRAELFCLLTVIREKGAGEEILLDHLIPMFAFSGMRHRESSRRRVRELLDEAVRRGLASGAEGSERLTERGGIFILEAGGELAVAAPAVSVRIETSLAPGVGPDQAAMFRRRFDALGAFLDKLAASPEGAPLATVLSTALTIRAEQILENTRQGVTRRIKDLIDYYYTLASRLHCSTDGGSHPPEPDYSRLEWRVIRDGVEFASVRGRFGNGPLSVNFLRLDPGRVRIIAAAAAFAVEAGGGPGGEAVGGGGAGVDGEEVGGGGARPGAGVDGGPGTGVDEWTDLSAIAAGFGAGEATTGGFFLYSEENLAPPMKRGDPIGLIVSGGRVISPPLFPRGALLLADSGESVIRIVGMDSVEIGFSVDSDETWFSVSAPVPTPAAGGAEERAGAGGAISVEVDGVVPPEAGGAISEEVVGVVPLEDDGAISEEVDGVVPLEDDGSVSEEVDGVVPPEDGGSVSVEVDGVVPPEDGGSVSEEVVGVVPPEDDGAHRGGRFVLTPASRDSTEGSGCFPMDGGGSDFPEHEHPHRDHPEKSGDSTGTDAGTDPMESGLPELLTPVFRRREEHPAGSRVSVSVVNRVVTSKRNGGVIEAPVNGFVLAFPRGHPVAASIEIGDEVLFRMKPDRDIGTVSTAMGGGPVLPCDGTYPSMDEELFTGDFPPVSFSSDSTIDTNPLPRLAWGIDDRDRLVAAAVDGRNLALSIGKSIMEMDGMMRALGCVRALNMDGGSSKRMCVDGRVVDLSSTEILLDEPADEPPPQRPIRSALIAAPRRR